MILSIDVGIKNLAICVLDENIIQLWSIINLNYDTDPCNAIIRAFQNLELLTPDTTVVIERQMTKKMSNIQCYLEMYFRMKSHKSVILYSPKHKLAGTNKENSGKGKHMYNARKKASIEVCKEWLEKYPQTDEIMNLWKQAKKKDDLADTLCQAIAFILNPIDDPSTVVKEIRARKPTARQDATGRYSKPNIKYLLQQYPKQKTLEGGEALPVIGKKLEKCILKFWPSLEVCMKDLKLLV